MTQHDYIIVGAGIGRLRAGQPPERGPFGEGPAGGGGGKDLSPNIKIPAAFANQFKTKLDWEYYTEPEPHVDGRELYIPRGKSLGGSSR